MATRIPSFRPVREAIKASVEKVILPAIAKEVDKQAGEFQQFIRAQRFPAVLTVPLSGRWLGYKRRKGLDLRTLISTGTYVKGIRARRIGRMGARHVQFTVDHHHSAKTRGEDLRTTNFTLRGLAVVHEFGSLKHRVPARPHWRPFWRAAGPRMRRVMAQSLQAATRSVNRRFNRR